MQESTKLAVTELVRSLQPKSVLDAPCGKGWMVKEFGADTVVDGLDLYEAPPENYRTFQRCDLDNGIPEELPLYDLITCCEGMAYLGNPELFLRNAREHLTQDGTLLISTPSVWSPESRLQFGLRGFFPGHPCLAGRVKKGTHMHIMHWSFPQLFLFLRLTGFSQIRIHEQPLGVPKHFYERILAIPQQIHCKLKQSRAKNAEELDFWKSAGSGPSIFGRNLIVTAKV